MSKTTVIAIAGASASGKSLFASTVYQELVAELGTDGIAILAEDAYYRDQSHMTMEQRVLTNYDQPAAFEHDLLMQHLKQLKAGEAVEMPQYSHKTHTRLPESIKVAPARVVMVEGILLLTDEKLREQFDISVFMDTPLDICLLRRIKRDIEERGRTLQSVTEQYEQYVRPAFFDFIFPSKQYADLVVTRGGQNEIAIDIIKTKIRQLLAE
ncbi:MULTISPECIES: uridine kinase [Idiomarina]|uniref:Uridine kinase n=1 Tax=Idiomarina zobellii TaxID=86103 RepID=A0A837NJL4_9GAMM|nr:MULTISPECIES: uridine kinase [Idiomarina]KTG23446.1 uridine kinase [Idiomarina sp. H105]OAE90838.1 uridine kinase [Idiomarina sp. WRN-38]KPD24925.1 uridine kinase [Idiomarina zobellii]MCJ8315899.1 uridine kinase [Idiomarina sp.]NQZ15814.1 uridine kinase [Idiomarina sp.]